MSRREFEAGPWGAGTLLYRVPDPERFGVAELDAGGRRHRLRGEAGPAQERPHPDRRLLPAPGRVRRHRAPRAVGSRRVRDHRRAQPLHPATAGCSRRVYDGPLDRRGHGPESLLRAAELARDDDDAGHLAAAGGAADWLRPAEPRVRRLLVTGGAGFIGSAFVRDVLARRDGTRITVLDKLTYAGNRANLAPVRGRSGAGRAAALRPGRHRRPGRRRRRSSPRPTRSSTSPPSRTSTARSSTPRRSCAPASSASTCCSRRAATSADAAGRVRFLQVSTDEVYGDVETGRSSARTTPLRAALARTPRPRPPASCSSASYVVTHGLDAVITRGSNTYGPYQHPEKLIPLFITNAHRGPAAAAVRRRPAAARLAVRVGPRRRGRARPATTGAPARPTTCPARARDDQPRVTVAMLLDRLGKPWSLVRSVRGPARPRPALRDGRLEAGRARLASRGRPSTTGWRGPSTGSSRTSDWWRGDASGDWDAYYERQYGWRLADVGRGRARRRRADRCASRSPAPAGGSGGALVAALADAPFTGPAGPIAWTRADFDLDDAERGRAPDRARPAGGRRPLRGVDRRRRLRPRPGAGHAPQRDGDRRARRRLCATRGVDLIARSRPTRCSTGARTDGRGYAPDDADRADQPVRRNRSCRARRSPRDAYRDRPRAAGIVRTAWLFGPPGQRLPAQDRRGRATRRGRRRAAPGRRRRVRLARPTPRTSPTRSSSCWPRMRSRASTTSSTPASPRGPTGRASSSSRLAIDVPIEEVPASTWPRASTPAAWAVLDADAAARRASRCRPWPTAMADYLPDAAPRGSPRLSRP